MSEEIKPVPISEETKPVETPPKTEGLVAQEGLDLIEGYLNSLIMKWEEEQKNSTWLWVFKTKVGIAKCARFIANATDGFIVLAEKFGSAGSGKAKKLVVTSALDQLYTQVIQPNLPVWLKSVGWLIRFVVVQIVIGTFIDFCVGKYNQGWSAEKQEAEVQALMTKVLISQGKIAPFNRFAV